MKAHEEKIILPRQASFFYRLDKRASVGFNWHHHPEYELTYVERGEGKRFVGDHISDFGVGDLVLLGSNLPHTWYSPPRSSRTGKPQLSRVVVIQFGPDFLGDQTFAQPEFCHVRDLLNHAARGLAFTGSVREKVAKKMIQMNKQSMFSKLLSLFEILDELGRSLETNYLSSVAYQPQSARNASRRIDLVCQHIEANFSSQLTQYEIAKLAHLTPAAFSRFFKKSTGKAFIQYVREIRIGKACQLLIETDLPIIQIGYDCGFGNISNFNRCFLQLKNMPPGIFRQRFVLPSTHGDQKP